MRSTLAWSVLGWSSLMAIVNLAHAQSMPLHRPSLINSSYPQTPAPFQTWQVPNQGTYPATSRGSSVDPRQNGAYQFSRYQNPVESMPAVPTAPTAPGTAPGQSAPGMMPPPAAAPELHPAQPQQPQTMAPLPSTGPMQGSPYTTPYAMPQRYGLTGGYTDYGYPAMGVVGEEGCKSCKECCDPCCCGCSFWYGSVGGVYMDRDSDNPIWLSFDTSNIASMLLGTPDAEADWAPGPAVTLGHSLHNGCNAIEMTYWGVLPGTETATAFDPDGTPLTAADLNTSLDFGGLEYNGSSVNSFYDNAFAHRLDRSYEFHNVEINYIGSPNGPLNVGWMNCAPRLRFEWLAGLRYIKFQDRFLFWTDPDDANFDSSINEVRYNVNAENYMFGGQLGGRVHYAILPRFSVFGGGKVGLMGVRMTQHSVIGGAAGDAVVNDPASPYDGQAYNIKSNKDDVAMLAEFDFGGRFQMTRHWSAAFGYRVVGLSGVVLSTNQLPQNFADLGAVRHVDSNADLLLHGGYFNFEFLY